MVDFVMDDGWTDGWRHGFRGLPLETNIFKARGRVGGTRHTCPNISLARVRRLHFRPQNDSPLRVPGVSCRCPGAWEAFAFSSANDNLCEFPAFRERRTSIWRTFFSGGGLREASLLSLTHGWVSSWMS